LISREVTNEWMSATDEVDVFDILGETVCSSIAIYALIRTAVTIGCCVTHFNDLRG